MWNTWIVKLEHLLLGILLVKPRTGYELSRYMETDGVFLRPKTQMSQVYRSLAKMSESGLVTFTTSARPGAQDAKIYRATAAGAELFMEWLRTPFEPVMAQYSHEFRARLFFSGFLGEDALIELLTTEIDARRRQIATFRHRDRTIEAEPQVPFDLELTALVEDFQHESGAAAVDEMVARLVELREIVRERLAHEQRTTTDASARD
jgi:PadR family transcriptional regulator AphA